MNKASAPIFLLPPNFLPAFSFFFYFFITLPTVRPSDLLISHLGVRYAKLPVRVCVSSERDHKAAGYSYEPLLLLLPSTSEW